MTQYGYMRVSKHDGSQVFDLQRDALMAAGVVAKDLYEDRLSGRKESRPGLDACLKAMHAGDVLLIWRLDRLGRSLRHLMNLLHALTAEGIAVKVLTGEGAALDTTTANGKLIFTLFAALSEFEADLLRERTLAGLDAARARGRHGGRPPSLSGQDVALAESGMAHRSMSVAKLAKKLGVSASTLYRTHRRAQQHRAAAD